jgi:hypothetical protein
METAASRWVTCLLLLAAGVTAARPAAAQDAGVYRSYATTDIAELAAPRGVGAYIRILPRSWLSMRVGYHRHEESSQRVGTVCNNIIVMFMCNSEDIDNVTRVHGAAATAALHLRPIAPLELEIGGGVSLNEVRGSDRTASGRTSSLFWHESAQTGFIIAAQSRLRPLRVLPITLDVGVSDHILMLDACAVDVRRYDPYCGRTRLREVRIGAGFAFR